MFCAHCGNEVQTLAAKCPMCNKPASGAPAGKGGSSSAVIIAVVVAVLIIGVVVTGIVAAIAIPNLLNAIHRGRQKRTMSDMRTMATAVEAYGVDFNYYPDADSMADLAAQLQPKYIAVAPSTDGWNNRIRYECWKTAPERDGCDSYIIVSAGKDLVFEYDDLREYGSEIIETTLFDDDIVYQNGQFTQYPSGIQRGY